MARKNTSDKICQPEFTRTIQKLFHEQGQPITKQLAEEAFKTVVGELRSSLERGETVFLRGVGTFKVVDKAERTFRIPTTGKMIILPASKKVRFSICAGLKAKVDEVFRR